jgi:hypothetical protein
VGKKGRTSDSLAFLGLQKTGKPRAVGGARISETTFVLPQLRLFALEEAGRLKSLKLERYAPRRSPDPMTPPAS